VTHSLPSRALDRVSTQWHGVRQGALRFWRKGNTTPKTVDDPSKLCNASSIQAMQ